MPKKIKITLVRSAIGRMSDQKATIRALGIHRLYHSVIHEDNPSIRGMIRKVEHLLKVEKV
jgi:large subunit ribosomal protein L30